MHQVVARQPERYGAFRKPNGSRFSVMGMVSAQGFGDSDPDRIEYDAGGTHAQPPKSRSPPPGG